MPATATKSHDRHFDGFKCHLSIDPGAELIDEVAATAGNVADREAVDELLAPVANLPQKPDVFADSAYADGETLEHLDGQGFSVTAKVPPAVGKDGRFSKDDFSVDLGTGTITCPAGQVADIRYGKDGTGRAEFGEACATCPLAERCTTNKQGRSVNVHRNESVLQRHKVAQQAKEWKERYKSTRPKVERKIAHMVRKPWGGRKARMRGLARVSSDLVTRAAVVNFARLGVLGVRWDGATWVGGP
jgi:IS5 family transposase